MSLGQDVQREFQVARLCREFVQAFQSPYFSNNSIISHSIDANQILNVFLLV